MRTATLIGLALAIVLVSPSSLRAAVLESPAGGAILSGLGFISGWHCHAGKITVTIDENGEHVPVAMHQERADLRTVCGGTTRHGFLTQINWALLGDGEHIVVAYADGVEFARATFTVGSTGEEFLTDARRRSVIKNFPTTGEDALVEWNESTQHFEVLTVFERPGGAVYDEEWWRQYNEAVVAWPSERKEVFYAVLPDVAACAAGELATGTKNRALAAANQIRGLHGLAAVQYSSRYDQQVQEAALIQAANQVLNHRPPPDAKCYSPAGAAGSRTSNLAAGSRTTLLGVERKPEVHMVKWTNSAGHRRWLLNPFAVQVAYGQVEGYATQKVFGFDAGPAPRIAVDFVAFPFQVYPFNLVLGDPPWSFSVIEDKDELRGNKYDYFREATITVTRAADGVELRITDRYTDSQNYGLPNFLSWQVEGWEYDTLYEVEIGNVIMQSGATRSFSYPVFIERENLRAPGAISIDDL